MGFSDKMRDSLGVEGAKIEVIPPVDAVPAGSEASLRVVIVGGSKAAAVGELTLKLVEADRHWLDGDGATLAEAAVAERSDRDGLVAGWTRKTLHEQQVPVDVTVEAGARHEIAVRLAIPATCKNSGAACNHSVLAQVDIKGQIDPSGQARLRIG